MTQLVETIQRGWPDKRSGVHKQIQEYWNFRNELSVADGIVVKGDRLAIPQSLRPTMLQILHSSHLGVESCLRRAREVLFWPGMAKDIKITVAKCWPCQKYAIAQRPEPLLPHETPSRPWQKVAVDYFQMGKEHFLVMSDYYSSILN